MSGVRASRYYSARLVLLAGALLALVLAVTSAVELTPLGNVLDALVEAVGYDYVVPAVLGVLGLLAAITVFVSGRGATMSQTEMPTVERPVPVPTAGEPFDETIGSWRFATRLFGGGTAEDVRDRLRVAAVAAIAAEEGLSRPAARERVESGTWTDDAAAAAFLAGRYTPLGTWLRALASGETGPEYRARRTVAAIVAVRESEADERRGVRHDHDRRDGQRRSGGGDADE